MISIRIMTVQDYDGVFELWINTPGWDLMRQMTVEREFVNT